MIQSRERIITERAGVRRLDENSIDILQNHSGTTYSSTAGCHDPAADRHRWLRIVVRNTYSSNGRANGRPANRIGN